MGGISIPGVGGAWGASYPILASYEPCLWTCTRIKPRIFSDRPAHRKLTYRDLSSWHHRPTQPQGFHPEPSPLQKHSPGQSIAPWAVSESPHREPPQTPQAKDERACAKAPHLCVGRGGRVSREEPAPTGYAAPVRQHAHALGAVRRIHERSARWLPRADDLGPHATKAHAVAPAPGLPYDTRNVPSVSLQKAREVCLVP